MTLRDTSGRLVPRRKLTRAVGSTMRGMAGAFRCGRLPAGGLLLPILFPVLGFGQFRWFFYGSLGALFAAGVLTFGASRASSTQSWLSASSVRFFWGFVTALLVFAVIIGTEQRAISIAESVRQGRPLQAGYTFLFHVRADWVCISGESVKSHNVPEAGLYLGESAGWVSIFDPTSGRSVRVQDEGLIFTFPTGSSGRESSSC